MKQLMILMLLVFTLGACQGSPDSSATDEQATVIDTENVVTLDFDVEGMTCTGCETTVKNSLERMDGVVDAQASFESGKATVQYDESQITAEDMEEAIELAGYKVTGHTPHEK